MPVITMKTVFCCCPGQAGRQIRHGSSAHPNFHTKYGNGLLASGAVFCVTVWSYVSSAFRITLI